MHPGQLREELSTMRGDARGCGRAVAAGDQHGTQCRGSLSCRSVSGAVADPGAYLPGAQLPGVVTRPFTSEPVAASVPDSPGVRSASDDSVASLASAVALAYRRRMVTAAVAPAAATTAPMPSSQRQFSSLRMPVLPDVAGLTWRAVDSRADDTLGATEVVTASAASSSRGAAH